MFQTDRVDVRPLTANDLDDLVAVYGDADAMRWVGDGEPLRREQCLEWLAVTHRNYATRGYGMSTLVLRETGAVIGFCGLVHPGGQPEAEIKYALRREYWGRGLATEAVRGMLAYGAREFGLAGIIATVAAENRASLRVLAKAGMRHREDRPEGDGSVTRVLAWRPVVTIFETERLLFRRLVPADLDDLCALYQDPEVRRYFPEGTLSRDETLAELEWFRNGHPEHPELGLWATIQKESGRFVGRCGLLPWIIDDRLEIEIAYMVARDLWRQGFGTEAARGLVAHGFGAQGLSRLIALIDPGNEASMKTARKAGLQFERDFDYGGMRTILYAIERTP